MSRFQAIPMASSVAEAARARAAANDPAVLRRMVDDPRGYPCRHCLRDGEVGETMLLFSHAPFETTGPYAETGPVFVHERACEAAALAVDELPEVTRVRARVVLRAYAADGAIHHSALVESGEATSALQHYFDDDAVAFVHARAVTNGCFTYAVVRA